MKFTASTKPFLEALQSAAAIAKANSPKEILKCVMIDAGSMISVAATDSEIALKTSVTDCSVDGPGRMLIHPQRLVSILREADTDTIDISEKDGTATCKAGRSRFTLQCMNAEDFPAFAPVKGEPVTVDGQSLSSALERTTLAADEKSTRYALGGVLFDGNDVVALDGRRLSVSTMQCSFTGRSVVPLKACKAISQFTGDVSLTFDARQVYATCGDTQLTSLLVEGAFPQHRQVIPKSGDFSVSFVAGPLLKACRQAMIVMNEESRGCQFAFSQGVLRLSATGNEVGTSDVELPIDCDRGMTLKIDPRFLADWLKTFDAAALVEMDIGGSAKPVVLKCASHTYVVMPMVMDQ